VFPTQNKCQIFPEKTCKKPDVPNVRRTNLEEGDPLLFSVSLQWTPPPPAQKPDTDGRRDKMSGSENVWSKGNEKLNTNLLLLYFVLFTRIGKGEEDDDMHAANIIMQNKHYDMSRLVDDEYDDLGDAPTRKSGDAGGENKSTNRHLT